MPPATSAPCGYDNGGTLYDASGNVWTVGPGGEADERLATLFDITFVQGDPTRFDVHIPTGFELTSVSGPSVEESTIRDGVVSLTVREPSRRRHQFLITFERVYRRCAFVKIHRQASVTEEKCLTA